MSEGYLIVLPIRNYAGKLTRIVNDRSFNKHLGDAFESKIILPPRQLLWNCLAIKGQTFSELADIVVGKICRKAQGPSISISDHYSYANASADIVYGRILGRPDV